MSQAGDEVVERAADGTRLFFRIWSPDSTARAAIALVHGLGEHGARYAPVAAFFRDAGFATIALDCRGHGRTDGKRGHLRRFDDALDDIDQLVGKARPLAPGRPIILYGHSMGGCLALLASLRRRPPIAGLIATSPALRAGFDPPAWKLAMGRVLDRVAPGLTLGNELDATELSSDPSVAEAYLSDPLVHDRISVRWFNEWRRAADELFARSAELPGPILLLHGERDKLTSPAATAELARRLGDRATFRLWPGMRHELHHEVCKEAFLASLRDWIEARLI